MKLKHIDSIGGSVFQDARDVNTKFSKSFTTFFFAVGDEIRQTSISGKLRKPKNNDVRSREHLTLSEVASIIKAAKEIGRHGYRDATLILIAFRHGLRVSELVALRWDQVDLDQGRLHVHRLKGGTASTHPLRDPELRALRRLRRDYPDSHYLFVSKRDGPVTDHAVRKLEKRAGEIAGINFPVHPHMLRHACGYKLANDGHDTRSLQHYLGHKNIQHTVRYTELAADRFKGFWKD